MSAETEQQIVVINTQLFFLTEQARNQGIVPVNPLDLPESQGKTLPEQLSPSAFWCHYVSSDMNLLSQTPPHWLQEVRPEIDSSQRRITNLATQWLDHPQSARDKLNQDTTRAFLSASVAARWSENMDYFGRLTELVVDAGYLYARREGVRLIGDTP